MFSRLLDSFTTLWCVLMKQHSLVPWSLESSFAAHKKPAWHRGASHARCCLGVDARTFDTEGSRVFAGAAVVAVASSAAAVAADDAASPLAKRKMIAAVERLLLAARGHIRGNFR